MPERQRMTTDNVQGLSSQDTKLLNQDAWHFFHKVDMSREHT